VRCRRGLSYAGVSGTLPNSWSALTRLQDLWVSGLPTRFFHLACQPASIAGGAALLAMIAQRCCIRAGALEAACRVLYPAAGAR
jgi:hypothetical protein